MAEKVTGVSKELVEIKSPANGIFNASQGDSFGDSVRLGLRVCKDTIIGKVSSVDIAEVYDIKAGATGIISEALVSHGQVVNYKQLLFKVQPDF